MDDNTGDENPEDDSELDPRIQDELEKLNKSSAQINELENQLDEIRNAFRQLFSTSTSKMDSLAKDLGSCVEKARPFYAALAARRDAQNESLQALNRYDKACARLSAAKEMTHKAELNAQAGGPITESTQEALNHAISKVNEAEKEKAEAARDHQQAMTTYTAAEKRVKDAEDGHKRDIKKARPYFVMVNRFNASMKEEKTRVQIYEEKVQICKSLYAEALANLEQISEDIHRRRREAGLRRELGHRGQGVGAELTGGETTGGDEEEKEAAADGEYDQDEQRDEKRATRDKRRSQPPVAPPISSEHEPTRSDVVRRRRSSGLASTTSATNDARSSGGASTRKSSAPSVSQEEASLSGSVSGRPRSSHRRTRHRQRQLRISATPIVGFLAETANAQAREAARLQQRVRRHQQPIDAWSPIESADSDWTDAASLDGDAGRGKGWTRNWGAEAVAAAANIRTEEEAFEAWKQQEARLHDALHSYDGDDEDDVEEAVGELSRH